MIAAVIFDLDGVIIDSEPIWEDVRRTLLAAYKLPYPADATRAIMGMSSPEWSAYLHDVLRVPLPASEINVRVVAGVAAALEARLPLFAGAVEAVRRIAERVPVAIASSSNRSLIELAVERAALKEAFTALVSSEEVDRGKPEPDVYLRAAELLGVEPGHCGAVEDSSNGLRAAHAAGAFVVAVPNASFPPSPAALALADRIVTGIAAIDASTFGLH